jgi:NAD(P)H-hydrate epimerase
MRRIENESDAAGHTYAAMMDRAGTAVAAAIQSRMVMKDKRVLLLVGPSSNGGDGLVAARVLREAGAEVLCYLFRDRSDDPLLTAVREQGCFIATVLDDNQFRTLRRLAEGADVIVDALLDAGTALPIEGDLAKILDIVRGEAKRRRELDEGTELVDILPVQTTPAAPVTPIPLVVAVDGPTGLNYDTGVLDPRTLPADLTVTFAYPKLGHFAFPGALACGQLAVADIGTPPKLADDVTLEVTDAEMIRGMLPARPCDAHKGTFGKALIVAGSIYCSGAAALAAQAATRVGTGLVTLCPPLSIYNAIASKITEVTYLPLPDDMGVLCEDAVQVLAERIEDYQALLVGPGLSTKRETVAFVHRLLNIDASAKKTRRESKPGKLKLPPLVVDADALNALAEVTGWAECLPRLSILTPHPGEMARLIHVEDKSEIASDRMGVARRTAAQWGHIVILKGAYTVIAHPEGRAVVLPFANPALATAGSGDVLAGAIVGLLAQGLKPFEAAICGAFLHAMAGELARHDIGDAGVVASDLLTRLPTVIHQLR